ncbi:hypothetical protein OB919_16965 [Halobacteria archaeon AArc-curdl1]|uniref:Uncharacterized protein n=1 Tax=Natronosalvus hydrolyticus TaxID=2979988 RepID=A0AAP3E8X3_9EURY|nr:hypothetical protein [Halobacteria archaeon AArc-curdl1]
MTDGDRNEAGSNSDDRPVATENDETASLTAPQETSPASGTRSAISDELEVPAEPPDPETTAHVLSDEELAYPTLTFDDGEIDEAGGFDLQKSLDRETMQGWLERLSDALISHDIGIETPNETAILGVGSGDVSMTFDPDETHVGTLEVTFSVNAKLMTCADDPNVRQAGARGGAGFIPLAMVTDDQEPDSFRCYNWIDDPLERSKK